MGKRLVKSPKVYFRDSGPLHHFLGIRSADQLDTHPARGSSWEAFLVDHLLSAYRRLDPGAQAWFWRTAKGDEVDLLIETGSRLIPFEAKLHSAPGPDEARGLWRSMADLELSRGHLVYPGRERYSLGRGVTALPTQSPLGRPVRLASP